MVEGKVEVAYKQVAVVEHFFNIIYRCASIQIYGPFIKELRKYSNV